MSARLYVLIFLAVMFLAVSVVPVQAGTAYDAAGVSRPEAAGGVFTWFMEFARGIFITRTPAGDTGEDDGEGAFSKNPYVYVAAFWTEIVNAPKETGFIERIMAFLEAVRVR